MNFSEIVNRVKSLFCEEDDKGRTLTPDPRGFYKVSPGGDIDLTPGEKSDTVPGTYIKREVEDPTAKAGSISEPRETRLLRSLFDDIVSTLVKIPANDRIIGPLLDTLIEYRIAYYEWSSRKSALATSRKKDVSEFVDKLNEAHEQLNKATFKCFYRLENLLKDLPELSFALSKLYELQDFIYTSKSEPAKLGSILVNLETRLKNLGSATLTPRKEPLNLKKSAVNQMSGDAKSLVKILKSDTYKTKKDSALAAAENIGERAVEIVNAFYNDNISEAQAVKELFAMR